MRIDKEEFIQECIDWAKYYHKDYMRYKEIFGKHDFIPGYLKGIRDTHLGYARQFKGRKPKDLSPI